MILSFIKHLYYAGDFKNPIDLTLCTQWHVFMNFAEPNWIFQKYIVIITM